MNKIKLILKRLLLLPVMLLVACDAQQTSSPLVPPAGFQADPVAGQKLFAAHCSRCHGRGGKGTEQGPPLMHKIYEPGHHADVAFYMAARNGVRAHHWRFGDMPALPDVSAEMMGHIVTYVRKEQRKIGIR